MNIERLIICERLLEVFYLIIISSRGIANVIMPSESFNNSFLRSLQGYYSSVTNELALRSDYTNILVSSSRSDPAKVKWT